MPEKFDAKIGTEKEEKSLNEIDLSGLVGGL